MKKTIMATLFLFVGGILLIQGLNARTGFACTVCSGRAVLQQRCTVCHDTGRIERAGHDRTGWEETINRMMGKGSFGAPLSDEEYKALLDYLVSR